MTAERLDAVSFALAAAEAKSRDLEAALAASLTAGLPSRGSGAAGGAGDGGGGAEVAALQERVAELSAALAAAQWRHDQARRRAALAAGPQ